MTGSMKELIEEHLTSANHLSKRHIHPRLLKMFEMGGLSAAFTRADGQYMWDKDGTRYLDLLAGGGVFFIGRNHPQVNDALRDVLSLQLPNLSVVNASALGGLLAERLLELAGPQYTKAVFANSGSEAIEVCIRFTRYMTRRRRFLFLQGAFHGRTYGAISLCGFEQMKESQDPLMPVCTSLRPNDIAGLRNELSKQDVAALFIEPVQGMTTTVMDAEYMREAEALCRQYGTVFVADEIQTGLGRTGSWFASAGLGVQPGMMTVSKTLAGGQMPVSAVLMTEEVYEGVYSKFKSGPIYFSTFAENNLAMAAGIATLDVLRELDAPNRARELGDMLHAGLIDLASRYDCIDRISGKGLMLAIYFKDSGSLSLRVQQELIGVADKGAFAAAVNCDMFAKQRVIVQIPGPAINAIKILPPVTITNEDVSYFLGALDDTLAGYYKVGGPVISLAGGAVKDALRNVKKVIPGLGGDELMTPVAAASPARNGIGNGNGNGAKPKLESAPEPTPEAPQATDQKKKGTDPGTTVGF
ncbi:Putrescine aminotransferase [Enhygromyxa salina]|uniref:Putrescine aminotransferase n=2 Tax=Enhygromyxa salina TaxID=215803 RepID=A0A2S9XR37_9BACT|nr:Putrescine aminotransferase [Enhygromyxa salina]